MNIEYVDHPCDKATKQALNAKGKRVVDSKFKPKSEAKPKAKAKKAKPKD